MEGLAFEWEIRTADNRPVDTSALADSVEVLPTGEIKLTGLRCTATGLRARCILVNESAAEEGPADGRERNEGALPAGDQKAGEFIDFNIKPDPASKDPVFNTTGDYGML